MSDGMAAVCIYDGARPAHLLLDECRDGRLI